MDILPGFQVGMNLVRQAQAMKEERLNMMSKVMEQKQEAELFPLRIQEVQQGLKLKALQADVENFKREQFVGMAEADAAVAKAVGEVPPTDPNFFTHIMETIAAHPKAANSQLLPSIMQDHRAAMTAKAQVDRAKITAEIKAETAAQSAQEKMDFEDQRQKNRLELKQKDFDRDVERQSRIAERAAGRAMNMAEETFLKNELLRRSKSASFTALDPNVQEMRNKKLAEVMADRMKKNLSMPTFDEAGNVTDTPAKVQPKQSGQWTPPAPADKNMRVVGQTYRTSKGPMIWQGSGWETPSE